MCWVSEMPHIKYKSLEPEFDHWYPRWKTEPVPKLSSDLHACLQTHTLIIVRIINKNNFNKMGSVELVRSE